MQFDSKIIIESMRKQFFDLCEFQVGTKKLNLLYRGTRDGFDSNDFHFKCDNRLNTITIIETTKGYIFGGFTSVGWTSKPGIYNDPKAFLFSLVNTYKQPFLSRTIDGTDAIFGSSGFGPVFGNVDNVAYICIHCKSNESTESNAYIEQLNYKLPSILNKKQNERVYFCDSRNFQVKEMEVFQLLDI